MHITEDGVEVARVKLLSIIEGGIGLLSKVDIGGGAITPKYTPIFRVWNSGGSLVIESFRWLVTLSSRKPYLFIERINRVSEYESHED